MSAIEQGKLAEIVENVADIQESKAARMAATMRPGLSQFEAMKHEAVVRACGEAMRDLAKKLKP